MKTQIDTEALMVILLGNGYRRERADLIVRAVNSHEEMLAMLKHLVSLDDDDTDNLDNLKESARELIAKAEGK